MSRTPLAEDAFSPDEIDRLFAPLRRLPALGVAVSGGPDSTALLDLLTSWSARLPEPPPLHVLTVDHALRDGSAAEAAAVADLARTFGHAVTILRWDHPNERPSADIQAAARNARYGLMIAAARRLGLPAIVLAHTLDDQAETFLMRLERRSGVGGLAAMAASRQQDGIALIRPLLSVPKARLVRHLERRGLPFVRDPSNEQQRFLRVRMRSILPTIAEVGLTAEVLADAARRMARADAALDAMTDRLAGSAAIDHGGVVSIDRRQLAEAEDEVALRLLARALPAVRPTPYPPRGEALEQWLAGLRIGQAARRMTLAGTVIDLRKDRIWIYAEAGRRGFAELAIERPGHHVWDGRFAVDVAETAALPLTIGPPDRQRRRCDMPKAAADSLPIVKAGEDRGVTLSALTRMTGAQEMTTLKERKP